MDQLENTIKMLSLMNRPAFCVADGVIRGVNSGAQGLLLEAGQLIGAYLAGGQEEYGQFREGCLYLTLNIQGVPFGASVTRSGNWDIFVVEQDADQAELQAMALCARELREPLTSVMNVAQGLFPLATEDPEASAQVSRINRGLFQMLRVISNMSDAARYAQNPNTPRELREVTSIFEELFQRSRDLMERTDIALEFENLPEPVYMLTDVEKLERAVYNILSNALKFTPRGGTIRGKLTRRGKLLYLTVQDTGTGVAPKLRAGIHSRYLRQPGVEDSRFGIGLGMVLIRSGAAAHGGTVLLDHPEGCGARITMTMTIRQGDGKQLRSNILCVDYAGEWDHGLVELSDSLPFSSYGEENIL